MSKVGLLQAFRKATMSQASDPSTPSRRAKVTKPAAAKAVSPDEPAPPCFVRKLRKAAVGTGCDIRLRVSVLGNPEPKLRWYRNKRPLPPSEAQDPGGLWIRDCRTCDAGLYTCVASNTLGEATSSAVLAVMDLGEGRRLPQHIVPVKAPELMSEGARGKSATYWAPPDTTWYSPAVSHPSTNLA
ncbi:striated muscle preferentially expressed protein kinase-like isoform X2 [Gadus chalcogrammus]|uniref:striated muscle preferentially expressed protein kinase-like isoform X2 n=2 Tax=Gadus chalcogrammus TaxID=1042646 RepID=UPI0024C3ECF9|nr:striated muscle preferentially expressed protein kinase-like isoform X2 [Gadus chalcogrammus]